MLWGDGFEIETVLNCRVAAAGLKITEVPSVERERIFGETNLRTFADGTRVLRTLAAERRRAMRQRSARSGAPAPEAPPVPQRAAPPATSRTAPPRSAPPRTAQVPDVPARVDGQGSAVGPARPLAPARSRPVGLPAAPAGGADAPARDRRQEAGLRYAFDEEAS
jgi:hypothetical protein